MKNLYVSEIVDLLQSKSLRMQCSPPGLLIQIFSHAQLSFLTLSLRLLDGRAGRGNEIDSSCCKDHTFVWPVWQHMTIYDLKFDKLMAPMNMLCDYAIVMWCWKGHPLKENYACHASLLLFFDIWWNDPLCKLGTRRHLLMNGFQRGQTGHVFPFFVLIWLIGADYMSKNCVSANSRRFF